MLSGTGYPSGENYPASTGMKLFFYPHTGTGNPTGKILRVRVRVGTTRRVRTRCHLEPSPTTGGQIRWEGSRRHCLKVQPTRPRQIPVRHPRTTPMSVIEPPPAQRRQDLAAGGESAVHEPESQDQRPRQRAATSTSNEPLRVAPSTPRRTHTRHRIWSQGARPPPDLAVVTAQSTSLHCSPADAPSRGAAPVTASQGSAPPPCARLCSKDAAPSRGAILAAERHLRTDELVALLGEHLAAAIPGSHAGLPAAPSGSGEGSARCLRRQRLGLREPPEPPVREGDTGGLLSPSFTNNRYKRANTFDD
jgi:hypothetical protein